MQHNEFSTITIPTYIINLKERPERLQNVLKQFENKPEFTVQVIEACKHKTGAVGLWQSIIRVINLAIKNNDDVIVVCEDDHVFTEAYNRGFFIQNVLEAYSQGCDILNGGIGNFSDVVPITRNRFWVHTFHWTQFVVLYAKFFSKILNEKFHEGDAADVKYSEMTSHKMLLCPLISKQQEFGYSDVSYVHDKVKGHVTNMFIDSEKRLLIYQKVYDTYQT